MRSRRKRAVNTATHLSSLYYHCTCYVSSTGRLNHELSLADQLSTARFGRWRCSNRWLTLGYNIYRHCCFRASSFVLNCASVSVPGRIDGQQQDNALKDNTYKTVYSPDKGRSLVAPAGWAFSIWGPIYTGEAIFCGSLLLQASEPVVAALPAITAPFVAANILQSLWCASFRPSYSTGSWQKYVSMGMLGGTAFALSQVHSAAAATSWYFLPLTWHFGWVTAATLVNLNGSVAMSDASDSTVIAVGHGSALAATLLGVGVTLTQSSAAYGLTVAWALAACADGIKRRRGKSKTEKLSPQLESGMKVQQVLCFAGSGICAAAAAAAYFM